MKPLKSTIQINTSITNFKLFAFTLLIQLSIFQLKAQTTNCPNPGTCNTDCTNGNIEVWNDQTCECEIDYLANGYYNEISPDTLNGVYGFSVSGIYDSDKYGYQLNDAGDFNGDGYDDIITSTPESNGFDGFQDDQGYICLIYGANNINYNLELSNLNSNNGFVVFGTAGEVRLGNSISTAGDFNNDGFDDIIVGSPNFFMYDSLNNIEAGAAYIIYGSSNFNNSFTLDSLNGNNGFRVTGTNSGPAGENVGSAGDFNNDGFDDIVISALESNSNGLPISGYIIFGNNNMDSTLNTSEINATNGITIYGNATRFDTAGDINNDGFDDLLISYSNADPNGILNAGESYVIYGSNNLDSVINLNNINGMNGFKLIGINATDRSGSSISALGDINNDGFDDIIIGASGANPNGNNDAGESYIIYGGLAIDSAINLSDLNGTNGIIISGLDAGDLSGHSVSKAGDVNNDSFDDIIIGAHGANQNGVLAVGKAYVLYGDNNLQNNIDLSNIGIDDGFIINGTNSSDLLGRAVSTAGDVNNDGFDDLVIGATGVDVNGISNVGESYVIYGGPRYKNGCTYETALNYDANANCDDGTCFFCIQALNITGTVITGIYEADDRIVCSGQINENSQGTVTFQAGSKNDGSEYIELINGFEAGTDFDFNVANVGCDPSD